MKGKNFIIPLVIYPFDIMVSLGESDRALLKTLQARLPEDALLACKEDNCLLNFEQMDNARTLFIWGHGQTIIRFAKIKPPHETIAHEIFHAVEFLMRKLNMPLTLENDEAYAYLIGYITEQFYSKIA